LDRYGLYNENPSLIQIVELPPAITQPMFTFANTGTKKYITIDYGSVLSAENNGGISLNPENLAKNSVELAGNVAGLCKNNSQGL